MDQAMYAKAIASIREFGFVDPITVRTVDGRYQIIDGEHRWRAAKDEGITTVPIVDLGEQFDCLVVDWRPRASIVSGDTPISFFGKFNEGTNEWEYPKEFIEQ